MRALIVYPSRGGQIEQIARRIAVRMKEEGAAVDLYNVANGPADEVAVDAYDAVVLGSRSQHRSYHAQIERCIGNYRQFLSEVPTALFVVRQQADRTNRNRHDGFGDDGKVMDRLRWQPSMQRSFAGNACVRQGKLRCFGRLLAMNKRAPARPAGQKPLTNWRPVDEFACSFARFVFSCKQSRDGRRQFDAWPARPLHEYSVVPTCR